MATPSFNLPRTATNLAQTDLGKLVLGIVGGALAISILPTLLRFTVRFSTRMVVGVVLKALPIVIAGLLAEKAAEEFEED